MARIPIRSISAPFGTFNPAAGGGRNVAPPSLRLVGPALPLEHFDDRQLNEIQRNVVSAVGKIKALPFGDGNLIAAVAFTSGTSVALNHKLSRAWQGYMVVNVSGQTAAGGFTIVPQNSDVLDARQITLKSFATCVGDVWVY